jgi:large subunit ribosomal protein L5e
MPFVRQIKHKQYFKRFQVKFRRRREGKTDYRARKRLCCQAKNKYNSPKYRLVVRVTNKNIICQIAFSEIIGDKVICSAYSSELERYGLKAGQKNYPAAYCTGLLCARRLLKKMGLDDKYKGNEDITGEVVKTTANKRTYFVEELDADKRPFRCNLDVGVQTTTCGARIFGAMKGAADGGLDVPHNEKRFPGYDADAKSFEAEVLKDRIFGNHISEYMSEMKEEDPDEYQRFFAKYIAGGVDSDSIEDMYTEIHAAIRADPSASAKSTYKADKSFKNKAKKTLAQRRIDSDASKAEYLAAMEEDDEDDEDDEEQE